MRSGTASSSARSCDTRRTVPGNASSAASSASRLSRSRWFVGSSRTRKFAPEATRSASARRRRSPPDSAVTARSCVSQPEKRKRPSRFWACGREGWWRRPPCPAPSRDPGAPARVGRSTRGSRRGRAAPRLRRAHARRGALRGASSCRCRSGRRARPFRHARSRSPCLRAGACRRLQARFPLLRGRPVPERGGERKSNPSVRRLRVSDSCSPAARARSFSRRPICVSFAWACFAFDFL